jgi:pre-mRNA-splicing helicase BRR2
MQDNQRMELLQLNPSQLSDVAHFCNRYPNIELSYKILDQDNLKTGNSININITLERLNEVSGTVLAPLFPQKHEEGWWVVIGELKSNTVLSIKRLIIQEKTDVIMEFLAPVVGKYDYVLYLISDCYMGCDHEYKFSLNIV